MQEAMVDLVACLPLDLLYIMGRNYNPDNLLFVILRSSPVTAQIKLQQYLL